jgi:hypothetical protein
VFYATSTRTQKIQRLTQAEIRNHIYGDPDNSWEDLHCRNPSHLYVGFTQVNRTVRAEFGPLYNFVREVPFPELGYIVRQVDPEDGQWYDEIIPIFSALGERNYLKHQASIYRPCCALTGPLTRSSGPGRPFSTTTNATIVCTSVRYVVYSALGTFGAVYMTTSASLASPLDSATDGPWS